MDISAIFWLYKNQAPLILNSMTGEYKYIGLYMVHCCCFHLHLSFSEFCILCHLLKRWKKEKNTTVGKSMTLE